MPKPTNPYTGERMTPSWLDVASLANPVAMAYPMGVRVMSPTLSGALGGVGSGLDDAMGGLNVGHAMWRAGQNWPGEKLIPSSLLWHGMESAAQLNPIVQQLFKEHYGLRPTTLLDMLRWFGKSP